MMRISLCLKEELKDVNKVLNKRQDDHIKIEIFSDSDSSPTQTTGPLCLQIYAQEAYEVGFKNSEYG